MSEVAENIRESILRDSLERLGLLTAPIAERSRGKKRGGALDEAIALDFRLCLAEVRELLK